MKGLFGDSFLEYQRTRQKNWDRIAREEVASWSGYYHRHVGHVFRQIVPPGASVLEIGAGKGDLLASLKPSIGVGIDLSPEMVKIATARHPQLVGDVHEVELGPRTFEFIILSDVINDLWDVQAGTAALAPLLPTGHTPSVQFLQSAVATAILASMSAACSDANAAAKLVYRARSQ
jgi:SAM-dependent methyltransferase